MLAGGIPFGTKLLCATAPNPQPVCMAGLAASTLSLSSCQAVALPCNLTSMAWPAQHGAWPALTTQPLYVCGFSAARCCLKNSLSLGRLLRRSQKHWNSASAQQQEADEQNRSALSHCGRQCLVK